MQLVHIQLFLAGGEVKCAVVAYLPEERGAQDFMIYLVGVAEFLTAALLEHLLRKWLC